MWSGFSSEIETQGYSGAADVYGGVACGAASRLRLKPEVAVTVHTMIVRRMWSGFSSEIETPRRATLAATLASRMWSGFSSEIETMH